eukprot:RCo007757
MARVPSFLWIAIVVLCRPVAAQFWIGGTISWRRQASSSRLVLFTVSAVVDPNHYPTYCTATKCPGAVCAAGSCTSLGAVPLSALNATGNFFNFGDGTGTYLSNSVCAVASSDSRGTQVQCAVNRTYTSAGTFTASLNTSGNSTWVPNLAGSSGKPFGLTAKVNLTVVNSSPVSALLPVVQISRQASTFSLSIPLPIADPDYNDTLTLSFSSASLFGLSSVVAVPALSVDSTSVATLLWNVRNSTLVPDGNYSVSVQATDSVGNAITLAFILALTTYNGTQGPATYVSSAPSGGILVWKGEADALVTVTISLPDAAVPTLWATVTPSQIQVSSVAQGSSIMVSVALSAASQLTLASGVYPLCLSLGYGSAYNGALGLPYCLTISVYAACPNRCTSPANGVCIPSIFSSGTCQCLAGYYLNDCRVFFHDTVNVIKGVPLTLAAELVPNYRGAQGNLTVVASLPTGVALGTDLWLHLPSGWRLDSAATTVVWMQGVANNSCGTTPTIRLVPSYTGDVIEIRCNGSNGTFVLSGALSFTATNITAANNCNTAHWVLEARTCGLQNLYNQGVIFTRKCQPASSQLTWSVDYNAGMRCDICNSCAVTSAVGPSGQPLMRCEDSGVVFWREAVPPGPCCAQGDLCS